LIWIRVAGGSIAANHSDFWMNLLHTRRINKNDVQLRPWIPRGVLDQSWPAWRGDEWGAWAVGPQGAIEPALAGSMVKSVRQRA